MYVFPKISLRPEVENYLKESFLNEEVVSASSQQEAERNFETLLLRLSHPPLFTTVRVNTHLGSVEHVRGLLLEELQKQFGGSSIPVLQHPALPDVLLIPMTGPRKNIERQQCEVIVGAQCGNAVLRGAHVYVPGVVSASKFMKAGDVVSVYSDIKGKCKKGAKEFDGTKVFLGNGISELSRKDIFNGLPDLKGIGIRMTEPIYLSPSFDNVLSGYIFLQNLPSTVVAHVLDPQPGEKILDLCAAPGGKTTHIAALMRDQGEVIALDKILTKVTKLKQNASLLGLHSIRAFCFDATKALKLEVMDGVDGAPPFLPESFDRILLDAPCSGLGQRPNMACTWTLKEVTSYQPLQRKLLNVAVRLLKPGGVLVYSTCTVTLAENEEQVAWALRTFPCLQLQPQEPQIGGEGMLGAGLSLEQLKQLQRFDPCVVPLESMDTNSLGDARREDVIWLANKDCIGFFIAKFLKCQSTERKVSRK
ncbi:NOL1/NOP2/Sun domain family, member 6 (predicted) [Rattus norvegicus]|uniref:NOL1/NOP2/Sun domain family, member 6 (Predicted) n=4 Tax=Rattus norvegicus TaxID=10116 RepID=F7ENF9_RAT|nr:tRNA (cytosine(72)-C(5))-methyltransferase NSUN6 [Rattus norvegicus]AAI62024.1 Nsun6 protein [Rattus norvegicus]EDL78747.1 NOL1/NOP2/Sun domain family, member 6 (predicted) [Rattus norvegicus]|eukprot:NP_001100837.1 putative methyltransferase NSUN6 [Rattus norvegicus]